MNYNRHALCIYVMRTLNRLKKPYFAKGEGVQVANLNTPAKIRDRKMQISMAGLDYLYL